MTKILGAAAITLLALSLTACGGAAAEPAPSTPTKSQIEQAMDGCKLVSSNYARIGDSGYSITLQGQPKYGQVGLSTKNIACVLNGVKIPDSVVSQIDSTRALDGTQKATWDKLSASWTYHPDDGVRIILAESK